MNVSAGRGGGEPRRAAGAKGPREPCHAASQRVWTTTSRLAVERARPLQRGGGWRASGPRRASTRVSSITQSSSLRSANAGETSARSGAGCGGAFGGGPPLTAVAGDLDVESLHADHRPVRDLARGLRLHGPSPPRPRAGGRYALRSGRRRTASVAHEVGHMLGMQHPSCTGNQTACYGPPSSSEEARVMGRGSWVSRADYLWARRIMERETTSRWTIVDERPGSSAPLCALPGARRTVRP